MKNVWRLLMLGICLQAIFPPSGLTDTLVVVNRGDDTASLIDLANGKVAATIPTGHEPHEVAISGDGKFAVVTNYGTRELPGRTLTVIEIPEARVVRTIDLGEYQKPHGIQWLYEYKFIVTAEAKEAVVIVDVASGKVERAIETGEEISHMIVLSNDRRLAFVANIGSGSVSVLDLNEWKRIKDISTGPGAEGISIRPDGNEVWVTNRGDDTVSVIDTATFKVIANFKSDTFPIRSLITPDGNYAFICNARSGDIAIFNPKHKRFYGRLRIPLESITGKGDGSGNQSGKNAMPISIVIPPDSRRAYVANANTDAISILDLNKWKVAGTLRAGKEPDGMAYSSQKAKRK
jgi:YVTN family beta-propeller protein